MDTTANVFSNMQNLYGISFLTVLIAIITSPHCAFILNGIFLCILIIGIFLLYSVPELKNASRKIFDSFIIALKDYVQNIMSNKNKNPDEKHFSFLRSTIDKEED